MCLKESLFGAGVGASDRFLAAMVVSLALESQIIILHSCYNGCLALMGGVRRQQNIFLLKWALIRMGL